VRASISGSDVCAPRSDATLNGTKLTCAACKTASCLRICCLCVIVRSTWQTAKGNAVAGRRCSSTAVSSSRVHTTPTQQPVPQDMDILQPQDTSALVLPRPRCDVWRRGYAASGRSVGATAKRIFARPRRMCAPRLLCCSTFCQTSRQRQ
jgi:hypothetical protein